VNQRLAIEVTPATYAKLKRLAVLAGTEAAAVERLIEHWERSQPDSPVNSREPKDATGTKAVETWRTPNGDLLPIGIPVFAPYGGKTYEGVVVKGGISYQGKVYDNPTSAGKAVKKHVRGLSGSSASTNGREFWKVRDPSSGQLVSIKDLNPGPQLDANELLREIMGSTSAA
jgi:hypothetical protein